MLPCCLVWKVLGLRGRSQVVVAAYTIRAQQAHFHLQKTRLYRLLNIGRGDSSRKDELRGSLNEVTSGLRSDTKRSSGALNSLSLYHMQQVFMRILNRIEPVWARSCHPSALCLSCTATLNLSILSQHHVRGGVMGVGG